VKLPEGDQSGNILPGHIEDKCRFVKSLINHVFEAEHLVNLEYLEMLKFG
jgi:hypothetical protein